MFSSLILDSIAGIIFGFLGICLVASAVTEAISSVLAIRQSTLLSGIQALLNDATVNGGKIVDGLYANGLVAPLSDGKPGPAATVKHKPAYVAPAAFAMALLDTIRHLAPAGVAAADMLDQVQDRQLRAVLKSLEARAVATNTQLTAEVAAWFDSSMDRLSGWYKRWSQWVTVLIGLLLAAAVNVDALHIGQVLWQRPELAAVIANVTPAQPGAMPDVNDLMAALEVAGYPIGWSKALWQHSSWDVWAMRLLGWLLTAASTLFGAPFWFDALQRIAWLRGIGRPASQTAANPA